ncbi:LysR family transcriptional regulator [Enterocloster asparagiformis]|uniref:LysR family transcriptional regulator n=1 Tax=Enterocloster asparagiformis TaxID=333367 RepID=UPI002A7F5B2A|nr:LysR family transcriptional regulator [Enterocloster asparagiformis]
MDIDDCKLLIALSQESNMTKAAERLYIAQSSVSYRLKNLETEFGVPLIIRNKTGITFTSQGKYLIQYAQNAWNQYRYAKDQIQTLDGQLKGEIRVGVASVLALNVFPQILKSFYSLYPGIEIYLRSNQSNKVCQMIEKDEIAVALTRGEPDWGEEKYLVYEEPLGLVSTFPLAIDTLPQYPYLSHPNSNISTTANAWWQQNFSTPPKTIMEVDNTDICLKMLLQGLGWSILPAVGLAGYPSLYFKAIRWKNGLPLTRKTYILCRRAYCTLPLVQTFTTYLKTTLPQCMEQASIQAIP